eukprot:1973637-Prymnesium_polylepis.1
MPVSTLSRGTPLWRVGGGAEPSAAEPSASTTARPTGAAIESLRAGRAVGAWWERGVKRGRWEHGGST